MLANASDPREPTVSKGQLEREAIRWLVRIKTDQHLDDKVWREFEEWLEKPGHRTMYLRVEKTWEVLRKALRLPLGPSKSPRAPSRARRRNRRR